MREHSASNATPDTSPPTTEAVSPHGAHRDSPNGTRTGSRRSATVFTEGSVAAHLVRLSGFMVMGFLTMTIAQLIEAVYLGIVGTAELAAIAFTFPLVMSLNAAVRGLGVGGSSVIARVIGSGDHERGARLTSHCLMLVAAFATLCVVAGIPGSHAFFVLLGAHGRALELADQYITIWFIGFVFFATSMVGTALMRSAGNAAMPGIVMTVGSLLQVMIAPFLIFGWIGLPALGIAGAAWAFVIARLVSFGLTMYSLAFNERLLRGALHGWLDSTRQILHVGIPAVASNLVPPLSTGVVTRLLAGFGHGVVAGFSVASRIEAVMSMVVIAVGASVGPFVGQNWGARQFERVREALKLCNGFCVAWGFASFVLMLISARFLVGLINQEPDVVDAASHYLVIIPLGLGFMGVMGVSSACFNALGKPTPPLVLSLLRLLVLLIPLALIGRDIAGYQGVFAATTITSIIVGVLAWTWNNRTVRGDANALRAAATA